MPTTSNFGWTTPADTDLVKDGAAAIRTLGNGIDTSLVDLKGGTTGQVLSKNSNTDLDYTWVTPNVGDITEVQAGTGISVASGTGPIPVVTNSMATEITAKGDLIVGTGSGTFDNLPVGTNGHTLVADSSTSTGLKWQAASSGALTKITSGSFSNVATVDIDSVFSSTYKNYMAILRTAAVTDSDDLQLQFRYSTSTETGSSYFGSWFRYDRANGLGTAGYASATQATLATQAGGTSNDAYTYLTIYFSRVGISSARPAFWGQGLSNPDAQSAFVFAGIALTTQTWTGFRLKSSSTNITGDYAIYGLAD